MVEDMIGHFGARAQCLARGRPIGAHRFSSAPAEDSTQRVMRIEATFEVHWLGVSVYRCHHLAIERWRGN
jgi:hypothetical protein